MQVEAFGHCYIIFISFPWTVVPLLQSHVEPSFLPSRLGSILRGVESQALGFRANRIIKMYNIVHFCPIMKWGFSG